MCGSRCCLSALALLVTGAAFGAAAQAPARAERSDDGSFQLSSLTTEGGLTADEAARLAVDTSRRIAAARGVAQTADGLAGEALWSMFPRVEVSGRYTRLSDTGNGAFSSGLSPAEQAQLQMQLGAVADTNARAVLQSLAFYELPTVTDQYAVRVAVSYPLSGFFLTILPSYNAAESAAEARNFQVEVERRRADLEARERFYDTFRARGSLLVAEAMLRQAEAHERQVEASLRDGAVARVELRRIEAQRWAAQVLVARAEGAVQISDAALRRTLHIEDDEALTLGEDLTATVAPVTASRAELLRRAFAERPELRALRALREARDSAATARAGARWPEIFVSAGVDVANPNARLFPLREDWRTTWDISLVARWSPNDFLIHNERLAAANGELGQADADLAMAEDMVHVEVVQALSETTTSDQALEAATAGVAAAEAGYRGRLAQLRTGAVVTSDLLDADADLSRARLDLLNAAIDVRRCRARLAHATGRELAQN